MTYAFIDTNILLHFKVFEGIKWDKFLGDKDYTLVICPTVLDEIDKHKDSSKSRIKNRAKKIFHILSDYLDGKKFNNVNVEFYDNPELQFKVSDYNGAREDEYIAATVNCFDKEGRKVIVTNDIGMKFRSRKYDLEVLMPPTTEEFLLAEGITEEEIELKKARQELDKYKNRLPKPKLCFRDDKDEIVIQSYKTDDYEEILNNYHKQLQQKNPHFIVKSFPKHIWENFESYDPEDIEKYNIEIDKYIENLISIKKHILFQKNIDNHIFELKFSLFNRGTMPTGNMGAVIILPKDLMIFNEDDYTENEIELPQKPILNMSFIKRLIDMNLYNLDVYGQQISNGKDYVESSCWNFDTLREKEICITLPSLNHNLNIDFEVPDKLFVLAPKPGEYEIKWAVTDEHNIENTVGVLKIIAE